MIILVLRTIHISAVVLLAPDPHSLKYVLQIFGTFGSRVFYMRRDLIELLPGDESTIFQILQRRGQHCVGDPGNRFFQFSEADRLMASKFEKNPGVLIIPLSPVFGDGLMER